jgi:hypothetical protein
MSYGSISVPSGLSSVSGGSGTRIVGTTSTDSSGNPNGGFYIIPSSSSGGSTSSGSYSVGVRGTSTSTSTNTSRRSRFRGRVKQLAPIERYIPPPRLRTLSTAFVTDGVAFTRGITGIIPIDNAGSAFYLDRLPLVVGEKVWWRVYGEGDFAAGIAGPETSRQEPPGVGTNPGVSLLVQAAPNAVADGVSTVVSLVQTDYLDVSAEGLDETTLRVIFYSNRAAVFTTDWPCCGAWTPSITLLNDGTQVYLEDGRNETIVDIDGFKPLKSFGGVRQPFPRACE